MILVSGKCLYQTVYKQNLPSYSENCCMPQKKDNSKISDELMALFESRFV